MSNNTIEYSHLPEQPAAPGRTTLHVLALLTLAFTFPLIFVGGLVTTKGAGMSVPDWPNSYGYNMFLFPPSKWIGGILYEHGHRLIGTIVGFAATVLAIHAWAPAANPRRRTLFLITTILLAAVTLASMGTMLILSQNEETKPIANLFSHVFVGFLSLALVTGTCFVCRHREPRRWVRWLCVWILVAVICQGTLGGLRVVWVNLDIAIVHACFAQAFFCLVAFACVVTSRWWNDEGTSIDVADLAAVRRLVWLGVLGFATIYVQLVVGAIMRHYQAGLAIPDLPLAFGRAVPPTNLAGLSFANEFRLTEYHMKPVTLAQIWLHFGHRAGAVIVSSVLVGLVVFAVLKLRRYPKLIVPSILLLLLLATQVTLGIYTVIRQKPADIASAHVAVGALVLMSTAVITYRSARLAWAAANPKPSIAARRDVADVQKRAAELRPVVGV